MWESGLFFWFRIQGFAHFIHLTYSQLSNNQFAWLLCLQPNPFNPWLSCFCLFWQCLFTPVCALSRGYDLLRRQITSLSEWLSFCGYHAHNGIQSWYANTWNTSAHWDFTAAWCVHGNYTAQCSLANILLYYMSRLGCLLRQTSAVHKTPFVCDWRSQAGSR